MFWTKLKRIIASGGHSFARNRFTSWSAILTMMVALSFITSLFYIQVVLTSSLKTLKDRIDITIYFVPGAGEAEINNIEQLLKKIPEVKSVKYMSESEALAKFKENHENDYLIGQALEMLPSNPLGASLNIKAVDSAQYESIANYFKNENVLSKDDLTIIDSVDYGQNKILIDKLTSIINGVKKISAALSLILILISVLITFNTIGLVIYISKEDIATMKLIGARGQYIRGPFVVTGLIIGITAALATIILFWPISFWLGRNLTTLFGINLLLYYKMNFLQLLLVEVVAGMIIGGVSSFLACYRYLRKK